MARIRVESNKAMATALGLSNTETVVTLPTISLEEFLDNGNHIEEGLNFAFAELKDETSSIADSIYNFLTQEFEGVSHLEEEIQELSKHVAKGIMCDKISPRNYGEEEYEVREGLINRICDYIEYLPKELKEVLFDGGNGKDVLVSKVEESSVTEEIHRTLSNFSQNLLEDSSKARTQMIGWNVVCYGRDGVRFVDFSEIADRMEGKFVSMSVANRLVFILALKDYVAVHKDEFEELIADEQIVEKVIASNRRLSLQEFDDFTIQEMRRDARLILSQNEPDIVAQPDQSSNMYRDDVIHDFTFSETVDVTSDVEFYMDAPRAHDLNLDVDGDIHSLLSEMYELFKGGYNLRVKSTNNVVYNFENVVLAGCFELQNQFQDIEFGKNDDYIDPDGNSIMKVATSVRYFM